MILSLAVLLIVVSSTVGAALVLGDRLWMAEGKCLLATAYTLMFAGFGRGLARWGAERAGRIMRLTTLIVLPVNFALVGELPGLGRSSALGLAVLVIDSAAMMALAWIVCRSLAISGGKGTPAALIALGMANALTSRSAAFHWGLITLVGASSVLAAACEWLGAWLVRQRAAGRTALDDAPYFAFGLLVFYDASAVVRIGGSVLGLPPTLYALPAMLIAAAAVRVADGLKESGHPERPAALLRLAGYAVSALAFALALARPAGRHALFSGNTLAVALLGLGLYSRALWRERRPAFLYAAFAALFLAYFGTHAFIKDFLAPVEGTIGRALGYRNKLPVSFRALNGLVFNVGLAGLARLFARRWKDERLALHCHLIGLPLGVAACILSEFEPLAAVLTLSGYTIAYAIATWLFEAPATVYLACAAFAGAAMAGSTFLGDLAVGARALALATVGSILWLACRVLVFERVPTIYRVPVIRSARTVAVVALAFAAWAAWPWMPPSWTGATALWVLAVLYALLGLEAPRETLAYAAVTCGAVAPLVTIRLASARLGWPIGPASFAAWTAAVAAFCEAASPWLRVLAERREARSGTASRARVYPIPLFHVGLFLATLAAWLAASHVNSLRAGLTAHDLCAIAATMTLVAFGLAIAAACAGGDEWLAYPAMLFAACGAVAAALALGSIWGWPPSRSSLMLACAGVGLVLVGFGDRTQVHRTGWQATYGRPLLASMFLLVVLAWLLGTWPGQNAHALSASLALTAITLAVAVRQAPIRPVPDLALVSGLAAWLVGCGVLASWELNTLARAGELVLVYLVAILATAEAVRRSAGTALAEGVRRVFATAVIEFAIVATVTALAMGAFRLWSGDYASLTLVVALAGTVFFWLPRFRREINFVYAGLILAWLATASGVRWSIGVRAREIVLGWVALATAIVGLVFCGLRAWGKKWGTSAFWLDPLGDMGVVVATASFVWAVTASALNLDAWPTAVPALLLLIPALAVSAAIDGSAWRVYAAIVAGTAAAYLVLFELERGRQGHVSALGVLASLLAILCWGIERVAARRARGQGREVFAVPLRNATIALALVALPFEWDAAGPLLLASVPFLLLVERRPAAVWLYPALALIGSSGAFAVADRWGFSGLMPYTVAAAFMSWGLGLAVWHWRPWLCRRLGPPVDLGYEFPPSHATLALGAAALLLRLVAIGGLGELWSEKPWVPAAIAVLSLLMLKPYPHRGWIDGFVGLMSLAAIASCGRELNSPMAWALAGMTLALFWRAVQWGAPPAQGALGQWLGAWFVDVAEIVSQWSAGLLLAAMLPMVMRIGSALLAVTLGVPDFLPPTSPLEWLEGLVALLLLGANLDLADRAGLADRLRLVAFLLWWLAAPASPLVIRLGLDSASIEPLATAVLALVSASLGARSGTWSLGLHGWLLSLLAVILTGGRLTPAAAATLFLATTVQGLLALHYRGRAGVGFGAAFFGSAFWGMALFSVSTQMARRLGWDHPPFVVTGTAVGQLVAGTALVIVGGWDRRRQIGLARVVEVFALVYLAIAVIAVCEVTFDPVYSVGPGEALVDVGVMFAVGTLCAVLASRWSSMPLAVAAQGTIVFGYVAYRAGCSAPPGGDAAAILILAGIDLGVAEVADRYRKRLFALPALAVGLALPLVSVILSFRGGLVGDEPTFVLFAAGTLYAASCSRMRWKGLAYAAAVLYNAALWVFWARAGWRLAAAPQLYIAPVGFSTILFAEANRRELGRSQVNAVRGVGLMLIYLSLAMPIWQTASLAAWATVLGVSLIAIFAGIGLRSQAFLWLGLAGFLLDVVYQLGRVGLEHALAKWAIMFALGIGLVLFVALNEKRRLVATIKKYVEVVRQWE